MSAFSSSSVSKPAASDALLLEAGDQPPRAELEQLVAPFAALERLAIELAAVVHDDGVARGGGAVDGLELAHLLAQRPELAVDGLVGHVGLALADLEPRVVAERRRRAHADLDREGERLALAGQVAEVELRVADRDDARLVDGLDVPAAEGLADGLVEDRLAAHPLDDHRRRDLALAEAGDAHLATQRARGLLEPLVDLGCRNLRLDAHARLGQLGDARLDA
jgi:hypothetical protein